MAEEFNGYKEDDLVEVEIADGSWVDAIIIYDQRTRVLVKLLIPVVWVERTITIKKSFLGFRTKTSLSGETSKLVETMTLSIGLVRDKTA